ncbi:MAG: PEP-CTERM sorting domain-containing protein [Chitinophagaceae bacterium]|nr:PEP-CTERM sorting domain-containing protein [Rubrivivax sp.]
MNTHSKRLLASALFTLLAGGAHAQANTGSLAGWQAFGDASAAGGAIRLTTAFLDGGSDQPFNLSGTSAVDIGVIEAAAGLPTYGLDFPEPNYGTEGSLVTQTFAVPAWTQFSIMWSFDSVETVFLDRAFIVINGRVTTLDTTFPNITSTPFVQTFQTATTVTLALGVIDTGDYLGVSTLTISDLRLAQLQIPEIPEPSTYALWLGGLAMVGAAARRRRG